MGGGEGTTEGVSTAEVASASGGSVVGAGARAREQG